MKQIIKITIASLAGEEIQTCNARELHVFLEVKRDFSTWIKEQIQKYSFIENEDYVKIAVKTDSPVLGSQERLDYFLSLDMAKELAMVSRTKKGKEARLYFIECERVAKEATAKLAAQLPNFEDPVAAARAWAAQYEERLRLENKIKEDAPKIEFAEDVQANAKEETITGVAKILGIKPRAFFDFLRARGYIYKRSAQATAKAIDAGLMVVRFAAVVHDSEEIEKKAYAHVTGKGLYFFYKKLLAEGLIEKNEQLDLAAA